MTSSSSFDRFHRRSPSCRAVCRQAGGPSSSSPSAAARYYPTRRPSWPRIVYHPASSSSAAVAASGIEFRAAAALVVASAPSTRRALPVVDHAGARGGGGAVPAGAPSFQTVALTAYRIAQQRHRNPPTAGQWPMMQFSGSQIFHQQDCGWPPPSTAMVYYGNHVEPVTVPTAARQQQQQQQIAAGYSVTGLERGVEATGPPANPDFDCEDTVMRCLDSCDKVLLRHSTTIT